MRRNYNQWLDRHRLNRGIRLIFWCFLMILFVVDLQLRIIRANVSIFVRILDSKIEQLTYFN